MLTYLLTHIPEICSMYWPTYPLAYLPIYLPTYLPTYLHTYTYLLTHIHTYQHTGLLTYTHTYLLTYQHTYMHTYLPSYVHWYWPTYLPTYWSTYLLTYLLTDLLTYWPISIIYTLRWAHCAGEEYLRHYVEQCGSCWLVVASLMSSLKLTEYLSLKWVDITAIVCACKVLD